MTWPIVVVLFVVNALIVLLARRALRRIRRSMRAGLACAASYLVAGGIGWAAFGLFGLRLEHHGLGLWSWIVLCSLLIGTVSAARLKRVPTTELLFAVTIALEAATLGLFASNTTVGLASPQTRVLLVAPAVVWLVTYFGASVGYLLWGGSGRMDARLGYELWIARRFLLSKSSPVLSTVTSISVIGVAVGVWLVIVSMGVLAGFEYDLQKKIIGANAHVVMQQERGQVFAMRDDVVPLLEAVTGVVAVMPFLQAEVAIGGRANYSGGILQGIEPERADAVLSVFDTMVAGSLEPLVKEAQQAKEGRAPAVPGDDDAFLPPAPIPSIVLGVEMQKALNVRVGDTVRVVSPLLQSMTPMGMVPRSQAFRVAGVFTMKMYELDARYAYVTLGAARRFFEREPKEVTGIQVRTTGPGISERIGTRALAAVGGAPFEAVDWRQRNKTLFSALKLERVVAFVVLVFIILVASFSIVNTLMMSVIEKRKEIAILKTMGARAVGVLKVFLSQGMMVGSFGGALGVSAGVLTIWYLKTFPFWIPSDVYYIDSLPVKLEAWDVALVVLAAWLIVWDFAVFPALHGSRLEPVEGLRDG